MTRIVAGTAGGRRIDVPPKGTRPTSDRVREALFSALESAMELDGARVLDLYAGSGALGFEALSRGAALATFVESEHRAVEVLRRNAKALGLSGVDVRHGTARSVLAGAPAGAYDLVLADPPYAVTNEELALVLAGVVTWTAPGGLVLVERAARSGEPSWPEGLEPFRSKKYGDTAVHWAERPE
ncbi:16S rRNA (guanine(966)-N(2))-methyltransferase RsmD [Kutzneria albida]|uniref:Methyltransferase n=1 Tax=Kutzneria albida DSM 43870 TaxID=1449976 RepID=W5WIP9_9PSEU|nr:16S rRNA (guanine(966)-N(2))-methyltransferase RsmD [Kutzneria albida]AHI00718.1 hypothetical protein KALB_7360 [Kutzneria albida DSM 43870]